MLILNEPKVGAAGGALGTACLPGGKEPSWASPPTSSVLFCRIPCRADRGRSDWPSSRVSALGAPTLVTARGSGRAQQHGSRQRTAAILYFAMIPFWTNRAPLNNMV